VLGIELALRRDRKETEMSKPKYSTEPTDGLRALLTRDHQELDQIFTSLLEALQADARVEVSQLWTALDAGLNRHMAIEEQSVLPLLRQQDAREANALLAEHDEIRTKLTDMGIGIDLHEVVLQTVADFIEQLRRHARREDALAYRWAEQHLPASRRAEVRWALAAVRTLRQRLLGAGKKGDAGVSASR
jgi:hemerythrin-like domain-containing protein